MKDSNHKEETNKANEQSMKAYEPFQFSLEEANNYNQMFQSWKKDQRNSLRKKSSENIQSSYTNQSENAQCMIDQELSKYQFFKQYKSEITSFLKAKFVLEQIVGEIQERKMLDPSDHLTIQFLHLLSFRAWCDINSVLNTFTKLQFNNQHTNEKLSKENIFKEFHRERLQSLVIAMYKMGEKIEKKFDTCHRLLSLKEKSIRYRLKSFFDLIFHNSEKSKRDNILFGVQGIDFTRDEQILYTQSNSIPVIRKKLLGLSGKNVMKMRNVLSAYRRIMQIQFERIQSLEDFEIVKGLIVKQQEAKYKIKPVVD